MSTIYSLYMFSLIQQNYLLYTTVKENKISKYQTDIEFRIIVPSINSNMIIRRKVPTFI